MGKEIITYDDLLQIVELITSADSFSEFHLKIGDIELDLRKSGVVAASAPPALPAERVAPAEPARIPEPRSAQPVARNDFQLPAGAVAIRSPMVGTFYRAPEPGARPFVDVGQKVSPDTTVCIIEVMKLMNSIPAGCSGTVTQVLVDDAEPVDTGQVLIVIDPGA